MFIYNLFIWLMIICGASVAVAGFFIAYTMSAFPLAAGIGLYMFVLGLACVFISLIEGGKNQWL
tara:strand:+ start:943 stop:1134 length:192 start_codon:yes stop_codon:yes gene_type:complete